MRDMDFFSKLLRLKKPWKVERVSFAPEKKHIDVWLEHRRHAQFVCPECRLP